MFDRLRRMLGRGESREPLGATVQWGSVWDVKVYLRDLILAWRAEGRSWTWIRKTLGPYAWEIWLRVEKYPAPATTGGTYPSGATWPSGAAFPEEVEVS